MNRNIGALLHMALVCTMLGGCMHKGQLVTSSTGMVDLPVSLPHGNIEKVIEDVFYVMGSNIVVHDHTRIQASRTMTIIREQGELTLINSIRLSEAGLRALEKLGRIKNVIRLGAFHGRDDAFYQRAYAAKLWAFPQMAFSHGEVLDYDLTNSRLPISQAEIIELKSTKFKEALLLVKRSSNILIACDSIKNWQEQDQFFDDATFEMMKTSGSIGKAKIDATWLQAMSPSKADLNAIGEKEFSILISAHGQPLETEAQESVRSSIRSVAKSLNTSAP